jgi:hypothetical protein
MAVSQIDYRAQQLSHICNEYCEKTLSFNSPPSATEDANGMAESNAQAPGAAASNGLTIHWDAKGKDLIERLQLTFHPDIQHVHGSPIDVTAIDKLCYDINDEDDDRNYFRLRDERNAREHEKKLKRLASELQIPLEQVESVLEQSREAAKSNARFASGKHNRKTQIFMSKPIPSVAIDDDAEVVVSK